MAVSLLRMVSPSARFCKVIKLRERCARSWFRVSAGKDGDVAQLVEHLLCKQGVGGSSPLVSTDEVPGSDQTGTDGSSGVPIASTL